MLNQELARRLSLTQSGILNGGNEIITNFSRSVAKGRYFANDFKNAAAAVHMVTSHWNANGALEASEKAIKANLSFLSGPDIDHTASKFIELAAAAIDLPGSQKSLVARMNSLYRRNKMEAISLIKSHSQPELRALNGTINQLRRAASLIGQNRNQDSAIFMKVFQESNVPVVSGDVGPVFSVTTCGNCNEAVLTTMVLVASAWGLGGIACPVCAMGAASIGFLLGIIGFGLVFA